MYLNSIFKNKAVPHFDFRMGDQVAVISQNGEKVILLLGMFLNVFVALHRRHLSLV